MRQRAADGAGFALVKRGGQHPRLLVVESPAQLLRLGGKMLFFAPRPRIGIARGVRRIFALCNRLKGRFVFPEVVEILGEKVLFLLELREILRRGGKRMVFLPLPRKVLPQLIARYFEPGKACRRVVRRFLRRGGLFFRVRQLVVRLPLIFQRLERFRELHKLRLTRLFLFQRDAGLTHRFFGFSEGELCFPKFAAVFFVHRRFGRIGGQRIELFPDLRELFLPCVILRAVGFQQTGEKFRELIFRRKLGVLRQNDPCSILFKGVFRLLQLATDRKKVFFYLLLEERIQICVEYLLEYLPAGLRIRQQQLAEFALRYHGDLTELILIHSKDIADLLIHLFRTRDDLAIRHQEFRVRLFLGRSGAAELGALIRRIALDLIGLSPVGEGEHHLRRRFRRGIF